MKWTEWLRPRSELITEQRLAGPKISPSARANALSLGLDSYGRAYSYYLRNAPELEDSCQPADDAELDWTELWRQFLVLDGLRVALLELDRLHEASLACIAFDIWSEAFNDVSRGTFQDSQFERRFAETSGFIRGRQVELTVQQAVEEARRKVVVSDPDAFANQVADTVAARLGKMPPQNRAQLEDSVATLFGSQWQSMGDARELFVQGEWLSKVIEQADGTDYYPVIAQYGRALEVVLAELEGRNYPGMIGQYGDLTKRKASVATSISSAGRRPHEEGKGVLSTTESAVTPAGVPTNLSNGNASGSCLDH